MPIHLLHKLKEFLFRLPPLLGDQHINAFMNLNAFVLYKVFTGVSEGKKKKKDLKI